MKMDLKEGTEEKQILLDKIEAGAYLNEDLKVGLKMPDHKNDRRGKKATLSLQGKPTAIIIKVVKIINHKGLK